MLDTLDTLLIMHMLGHVIVRGFCQFTLVVTTVNTWVCEPEALVNSRP